MTVLVGGIVGRDLDPLVRFYTERSWASPSRSAATSPRSAP
jgi:hypothetical protein